MILALYVIVVIWAAGLVWFCLDGLYPGHAWSPWSTRAERAMRAEIDALITTFRALPPDEQIAWIHPASPKKPAGWSLAAYERRLRRLQH